MKTSEIIQTKIDILRKTIIGETLFLLRKKGIKHINCDLVADGDQSMIGTDIRCEPLSIKEDDTKVILRSVTVPEEGQSLVLEMETYDNYCYLGKYTLNELETESGLLPLLRYIENIATSKLTHINFKGEVLPK